MRVTIKSHNTPYLEMLQAQWGLPSLADTLNHLIFSLRTQHELPINPQIQVSEFTSTPTPQPSEIPHNQELAEQIDPLIDRLISLGLCEESF
jgi:hypothetical protein